MKQIIDARVDEIIELVTLNKSYYKKIYKLDKPTIIFIGNGSKLLSDNNKLKSKIFLSKLIFFKENDSMICDAGIHYLRSEERFFTQK